MSGTPPEAVLGTVHFDRDGQPLRAVLRIDGTWKSPRPVLTELLDRQYGLESASPADGRPGAVQLLAAARLLGGRVEWPELPPDPPGLVY